MITRRSIMAMLSALPFVKSAQAEQQPAWDSDVYTPSEGYGRSINLSDAMPTHGWHFNAEGRAFLIDQGVDLHHVSWRVPEGAPLAVELDSNGTTSWLIDNELCYRRKGSYTFTNLGVCDAQQHQVEHVPDDAETIDIQTDDGYLSFELPPKKEGA